MPCSGTLSQAGRWRGFVGYLLEQPMQQEQADQLVGCSRLGRPARAAVDGGPVLIQERSLRQVAPDQCRGQQLVDCHRVAFGKAEHARPCRLIERAQHVGEVRERRALAPTLGQRPVRIAGKAQDRDVALSDDQLAQAVIAVQARFLQACGSGGLAASIASTCGRSASTASRSALKGSPGAACCRSSAAKPAATSVRAAASHASRSASVTGSRAKAASAVSIASAWCSSAVRRPSRWATMR